MNLADALRWMHTNWYFCSMDTKNVLRDAAAEIDRLTKENAELRKAQPCKEIV
jgi:hypothetical protein